jgi:creatinine amidohydrolase
MTWPQVAALDKNVPIVLPIAAMEQHGRHMPLFTDSLLLGEVLRRVKETLRDRVVFAPLMWLGNSHHHLDFPGTLTASPRVYLDMLIDLAENSITHGFRRIVFINGHGGNIVPVQQAMFELRQKLRTRKDLLLVSTTYWTLGGKPHEVDKSLKQGQVGHACEYETSMMLRLAPHLVVGDLSKIPEVPFGNAFAPATRAWITKDRTEAGHIGNPALASAEKGETIFRVFSGDVVKFLERVLAWDGTSWEG